MKYNISPFFIFIFSVINGYAIPQTSYEDGRPQASLRLEAKDQGIVFHHGDGPNQCDYLGARDVWVFEANGSYFMHYDGAGPKGWLSCLATSKDLEHWSAKGPILDFGAKESDDCASASYGTTYFDGKKWHMFYLGTPHTTPTPDFIPAFPYLTMKAEGDSPSGPWKKHYEVTPFRPKANSYYSSTASPGFIVKNEDEYLMYFSASTDNPILRTISLARTKDLNSKWILAAEPMLPPTEQIENSSLYFEKKNKTWFLFTNHVGIKDGLEYTDAIWVYWSKDLTKWDPANKAVVLDSKNCKWSKHIIGLPSVVQLGNRLAIFYDGSDADPIPSGVKSHMNRDIGLAWLDLPLSTPVAALHAAENDSVRSIIPAIPEKRGVDTNTLQRIYDEVKTPFKYGVVIRGEANQLVDSPSVFRKDGQWYMVYAASAGNVGYETCLARSADLLHWEKLGKILSFRAEGWDRWQRAGYLALIDPTWGGSNELQTFDGKYWMSFLGGALQGYETDPLAIGLAWTKNPTEAREWTSITENPVLTRDQPDVRDFEKVTLYKSNIIWDKAKTLGSSFVMYYNGKIKGGYERIGMAVSDDMIHWKRYGTEPVVANGEDKQNGISGDPQIVRIGDLWVMFYFGAFWRPGAFDTFACSSDLVHWTKWTGPDLVQSSEPWDKTYAHKPWVVKWNGVVYHFYCAVGSEGRVIALATSQDLKLFH